MKPFLLMALLLVLSVPALAEAGPACDASIGPERRFIDLPPAESTIGKVEAIYKVKALAQGDHRFKIEYSSNSEIAGNRVNGDTAQWITLVGSDGGGWLTLDGFTALLCHEIGHRWGGPHEGANANEGQADYYSASRCLPTVFSSDDNVSIVAAMNIPESLKKRCASSYSSNPEQALCQRIAIAGLSLIRSFYWGRCSMGSIGEQYTDRSPNLEDSELLPVPGTRDGKYPSEQCRLNTFIAGALCNEDRTLPLLWSDETDAQGGSGRCRESNGIGASPDCWLKSW